LLEKEKPLSRGTLVLNMLRRPMFTLRSFATQPAKKFRILGLQQIAIGSLKKENLNHLWNDLLGFPSPVLSFSSEKENVNEDVLHLGEGANKVEIDLMEPLDPSKSPKVHVPPLNHIGVWVDDLETCVKELDKKGVRFAPGGIRMGASGFNVAFVHPKGSQEKPFGSCGILLELVQAPKHVIDHFEANEKSKPVSQIFMH
jgi:lactoylglutathione lyase